MKTILLGSSIIERFPQNSFLNLGISGLTTEELQQTYLPILLQNQNQNQNQNPNIILYIGSNDISKSNSNSKTTQQIYHNITEFILSISNFAKNIVFVAILKSPNRTNTQIQKIDTINRKMREFSRKYPNIHFCNLNRELSSTKNYLSDNTHLSETGYSILSHHLSCIIEDLNSS
jgi:lysophospholipase L1-like esterase